MMVIATNMEARMAAEMAMATSEYNWPASSSINRIGKNTRMVVVVDASTAGQTSRTPLRADSKRSSPKRRCRSMFSSTTMLLSTVMPMAKAIPAREITLMVRPVISSPINAAMAHSGMPTTPANVARPDLRNRNITRVAKAAPIPRLVQTLATEAST